MTDAAADGHRGQSEPTEPGADSGPAGASAGQEYQRRRDRRDAAVRARHPRLGGLILALSDEPRSTTVWAKGAEGERKVGEALDALRSEHVVVLHDRRIPRSKANIDLIVIAPSGIHVIDTKRYKGKVGFRQSGSIFRPGPEQLFVNGRNQMKLVEAMARQVQAVQSAISGLASDTTLAVFPSLCFVDAEWGWSAKPRTLVGVRIGGPKSLVRFISEPGPLTAEQVLEVGSRLRERLKPAAG